jgi:hypothetical protein
MFIKSSPVRVATSLQWAQRSGLRLKCDGTRAETRFLLSTKRASLFKSAEASVQWTTGRRAVHISLQCLYCSCKPVFCSHVTLTGYPLHTRFPFISPPYVYRVQSHFNWTVPFSFPLPTWRRRRRLQDDVLLINTDNEQCLNVKKKVVVVTHNPFPIPLVSPCFKFSLSTSPENSNLCFPSEWKFKCMKYETQSKMSFYRWCVIVYFGADYTVILTRSPIRCNNFPVYYPDVYLQLNMFRAFSRPSSGAQRLQ